MGANELMCWAYLLAERSRPTAAPEPLVLSVEDEIGAWS